MIFSCQTRSGLCFLCFILLGACSTPKKELRIGMSIPEVRAITIGSIEPSFIKREGNDLVEVLVLSESYGLSLGALVTPELTKKKQHLYLYFLNNRLVRLSAPQQWSVVADELLVGAQSDDAVTEEGNQ